jgi:hypothetical protein
VCKSPEPVKFGLVSDFVPVRVVAVLLSSLDIGSRNLQVSVFIWRNPNVLPGGRNYKFFDTFQRVFVPDAFAVLIDINKLVFGTFAENPVSRIGSISKSD